MEHAESTRSKLLLGALLVVAFLYMSASPAPSILQQVKSGRFYHPTSGCGSAADDAAAAAAAQTSKATMERYLQPIAHGARYQQIIENATLQPWEDVLASDREPCKKGEWNVDGSWYISREGELFYEPHACLLRRLTAAEARQCLSNSTLTFVGDSLSRYQYLSLAHFLVHGRFIQRYAGDNTSSLTNEHTWPSWPVFYSAGSQLLHLNSSTVTSIESCDCYRVPDELIREFRTLTIQAGQSRMRVEYKQAFGQDHSEAGLMLDTLRGMREGIGNHTATGLDRHVMVVNMGHWFPSFHWNQSQLTTSPVAVYQHVFNAPDVLQQRLNGKLQLIWKTTTARADEATYMHRPWMHLLDGLAKFYGWDIMDAFGVTESMLESGVNSWWDALHFEAFVYDQLNDVLLNGIC